MFIDPLPEERAPWWRPRASTLAGLRLVRDAGPVMAPALVAVAVFEGLLPTAFTVVSGRLVAAADTAQEGVGLDSPAGRRLLVALLVVAAVFLVGEVTQHVRFAVAEGFHYRVEGRRRERAMDAALAPAGVSHLEDAEVQDTLRLAARTEWPDTGAFAVAVFGMTTTRVTAVTSAVLVAGFRWWLGAGLLVLWAWAGRVMRRGQAESWSDTAGRLRRAEYLRDLAFENLAAKELRLFGFGGWLLEGFSAGWQSVMRDVWRRRRSVHLQMTLAFAAVLVAHVGAFAVVAQAARAGELDAARLVVVVPAVLAVARFGQTDDYTLAFALGAVALPAVDASARIVAQPRFTMAGDRPADGLPRREIRFEDVRFAYPTRPGRAICDGLDLQIEAGRSLGIVGANGAGKTTLVKLLARLYDPAGGRITVDGVDLRELEPRQWQRRVAAIFQDFARFELTAADNVGFGAVEHLDDHGRLHDAAGRVGALDLVESLPHRWETVLSRRYDDGVDLSIGEWQKLALARAIFAVECGAAVLVLDEPTANLDVRAEVELFDKFLDVTRGATTILISHRFSTVRRADRIVVLESGRVVEAGTHAELVALGGHYAAAFGLQAARYETGDPAGASHG